jgi:hypothetical protein
VEHKKRGRPPLRPDEPSRRTFDPALNPLPVPAFEPSRRMPTTDPSSFAQGNYSRTFRPLQAQPAYETGRMQMRPPSGYPQYAPPSVQPSSAMTMETFVPSRSYIGSSMPIAQPPSPYGSGYGYVPAQEQMAMPPQTYSNPIFPPREVRSEAQQPSLGYADSLQLPPIRPALTERNPIDTLLAQQQQPSRLPQPASKSQEGTSGTVRQPDPKRPKMDIQGILGPRND